MTGANADIREQPAGIPERVRVLVIGAGFGGLGAAIKLLDNGITDFVVLARESDVGGTWQVNTYPGAQVDVPSLLYSYSFAPNPEWTRLYPLQAEIQAYLRRTAERYGVLPYIRFGREVEQCVWDENAQHWVVHTDAGVIHAQFVIAGFGPFSAPSIPEFPGIETFAGTTFHSAHWEHGHDLTGRRVAVIGTGASAVQFVPRIQPQVDHLSVFQRTPIWVMPHPDRPTSPLTRGLWRKVPGAQRSSRQALAVLFESLVPPFAKYPDLLVGLEKSARWNIHRSIADPGLREALTPDYRLGCKRPTFSNTYYPALAASNADVITSGIERIDATGIITRDGVHHDVDTIIYGTGFRINDHPIGERIIGRDGVSLAQLWAEDPKAYLGTTVSGLPNMFIVLGPNSAPYTSAVVTIEAQLNYIVDALRKADRAGIASIDVKPGVQREFIARIDRQLSRSVWATGGCRSYYIGSTGRIVAFWPGYAAQFAHRTRKLNLDDYHVVRAPASTVSAASR
ncbi:cyclohexanone monooxygenase [Nocardia sp. 852002-20019_SCH5090214]|jgi:cation diffusion facilitator CzcD-associated flavoprotein CzcO|uniref:flavin-containing monooxygenase n=1 Tax=Nocardia TaxID=1817 RepID=UPI0007EA11D6|nr:MULTISPECIES: NAD(P)/FAD-dependent oxidoreductase [Nocardia]OBA43799.1 cyclohexanone monooxygenase [Nocardia sp. 852002-20019_SCH5090214]PPI93218.1 NAD(P)/FAD-dependent oxidoreductase [Nocardia nova]